MTHRRLVMLAAGLLAGAALVGGCDNAAGGGGGGGGSTGNPVSLIGRSFEDPQVMDLVRRLCDGFPNDNVGNVKCLGQGFELNLMTDLSVGSVTLFNSETGGFSQFRGSLPGKLSWADTYPTVLDKLGEADAQYGGSGVDVYLVYESLEGHRVEVHFDALHNNPEDLVDAHIHYIHVS